MPGATASERHVATIYQTEIHGVQGFFVAPHLDNLDNLDKFIEEIGKEDQEPHDTLINESTPKTDGPGVIRTHDLRHVKAGDLAVPVLFFDIDLDDDMTTRKASAPS